MQIPVWFLSDAAAGWSVLASLVGLPLALVGLGSTFYVALRTKSAALAAAAAAVATRDAIGRVDVLSELVEVARALDDLRTRVENKSWEIISERCYRMRNILYPLLTKKRGIITEDVAVKLSEALSQIKILGETVDKFRFQGGKEPKQAAIVSALGEISEAMSHAMLEIKMQIGTNK